MSGLATDGAHLIASMNNDQFMSSLDGTHWTVSGDGLENNHLNDILYHDGQFVSVGTNHRAVVSIDQGKTWDESSTVRDGNAKFDGKCARPDSWCDVRWDGGQFVVYERGRNDVGPALLWSSSDGIAWTGEEVFVPQASFGDGSKSTHLGFTQWEVSEDSGVVTAIEFVHKLVQQNAAIPVLYRSVDGVNFEVIDDEIDGNAMLKTVALFRVPSE
jgi:hypothetical protein